ncbi:MAG: hypothetical protein JNK15_24625 [Planctomycetes bacterium]|nr:hypothetical protein [Planctomycetota bacterium]
MLITSLIGSLAHAQGAFSLHRVLPGTLGDNLQFTYDGVTQPFLVLGLSFAPGTIPLPPEIGNRPLELGPDPILLVEWLASAQGTTAPIAVPNASNLAGAVLQWQAVTLPGASQFLDSISNRVVTQLATARVPTVLPTTGHGFAWAATVRWPVANRPDRWIFAGGGDRTSISTVPQASSEVLDPDTLAVAPGPILPVAVYSMTATELADGSTILTGGVVQQVNPVVDMPTNAVTRFDPVIGQFTALPPMATPRVLHSAALLPDGRLVVAGGMANLDFLAPAALASVEVFDPVTQVWSPGPALPQARVWGALTALSTGDLLLHGGLQWNGVSSMANQCLRLIAGIGGVLSWVPAAPMQNTRVAHDDTTMLLADGRVLVAGGASGIVLLGIPLLQATNHAEVYDPMANTWTNVGVVPHASFGGSVHQLPDGTVVLAGGLAGMLAPTPVSGNPSPYVSYWDPLSNVWGSGPVMQQARFLHCGAVTEDGILVLWGGHVVAGSGAGNLLVETVR